MTRWQHVRTDPICIWFKEGGRIRTWLNNRGRGKSCPWCFAKRNGWLERI